MCTNIFIFFYHNRKMFFMTNSDEFVFFIIIIKIYTINLSFKKINVFLVDLTIIGTSINI